MIPELGHVALIIAFVLSIGLAALPMWGSVRSSASLMNWRRRWRPGVTTFVAVAFRY